MTYLIDLEGKSQTKYSSFFCLLLLDGWDAVTSPLLDAQNLSGGGWMNRRRAKCRVDLESAAYCECGVPLAFSRQITKWSSRGCLSVKWQTFKKLDGSWQAMSSITTFLAIRRTKCRFNLESIHCSCGVSKGFLIFA